MPTLHVVESTLFRNVEEIPGMVRCVLVLLRKDGLNRALLHAVL